MWDRIGMPEYVFIIFICTGFIVILNWVWINRRLPGTKFKELEPLLEEMNKIEWSLERDGIGLGLDMSKMYELESRLHELKINCPDIYDFSNLRYFLSKILSYCRLGKLRSARNFSLRFIEYLENKKEQVEEVEE